MNTTTIAVDLAKTVFELAIADEQGRLVERKRLLREGFARFFANRSPCRIVVVTHRHHRGVAILFSTDLDLDPVTLYRYYVARFQIEFLFRDSQQFAGLTHCQARDACHLDLPYQRQPDRRLA